MFLVLYSHTETIPHHRNTKHQHASERQTNRPFRGPKSKSELICKDKSSSPTDLWNAASTPARSTTPTKTRRQHRWTNIHQCACDRDGNGTKPGHHNKGTKRWNKYGASVFMDILSQACLSAVVVVLVVVLTSCSDPKSSEYKAPALIRTTNTPFVPWPKVPVRVHVHRAINQSSQFVECPKHIRSNNNQNKNTTSAPVDKSPSVCVQSRWKWDQTRALQQGNHMMEQIR